MRRLPVLLTALSMMAAAPAPAPRDVVVPPVGPREGVAEQAMVSAANPHAVRAGLAVLRRGGSAVDAAVAVQATLGLVEPQSSGLGGGAFMVVYDGKSREVWGYDGRETAPAGAAPDMFLEADGKPTPFAKAVLSGRATGVPGAVPMLAMAQKRHGRLPWRSLFCYAEELAERGFTVSPRLASMISSRAPQASQPDARRYFSIDGRPMRARDRLANPAYARTLRQIAAKGAEGLLEGRVGAAIIARVREEPMPGALSERDLRRYRPKVQEAICGPYRAYLICSVGPPSSGAALIQGMMLLERTDIAARGPADPQSWFLFIQASRLMYADRDHYFGDPAFVTVPVGGLLDPAYVAQRAKLIGERATAAPQPGLPKGAPQSGEGATREPAGTSHFVVVDRWGTVVSMTTTVESIFGSGRMVEGVFLNNQMTDFSFVPTDAHGRAVANAVAPGKRPRSSMSPVIVLDRQGRFVAAVGSPGGNSIPAYVMKTLVGVLDWKLTMQQAIELPNVVARGDSMAAEVERFAPGVVEALSAKGLQLRPFGAQEVSGIHGIMARGGRLEGGADPRREGLARGF
jgi:gamma-glutamyltranspeptidase / glutathione hydrolase